MNKSLHVKLSIRQPIKPTVHQIQIKNLNKNRYRVPIPIRSISGILIATLFSCKNSNSLDSY
ncbi:hypothetical protein BpHYR1_042143 [Brachionus plicatilis]|uniref:Uncharacterized protein n=1 Tax=Brachionus plicatilis TaxID=10195 RepID=A0A3M7R2E4_BRAPC|nr:hypothetical protein BpHYR1_042143 [Brachionus plicatilis]